MTRGAYRITLSNGERIPIIDENRNLRIDEIRAPQTAGVFTGSYGANAYQGSTSGFITGGGPNSPYANRAIIHKFPFASDTNSTDTGGDLLQWTSSASGSSSPTHGYVAGGYKGPTSSGSLTGAIEKYPFAISSGTSSSVGSQATSKYYSRGVSSDTHGYTVAGYQPGPVPKSIDIEKYSHSSDESATDVGDLYDTAERRHGYISNSARNAGIAFFSGGFSNPPSTGGLISRIQKFPFATDEDAVDTGGDLIGGLYVPDIGTYDAAGTVSPTHAYVAGGTPPYAFNVDTIQKFPFSISSGSATDVGDLFFGYSGLKGISSTTHGYAVGGNAPYSVPPPYPYAGVNIIQKWSIASDANGTDVGDMIHAANNHPDPGHQV